MTFETYQLAGISLAYLFILFLAAFLTERGVIPAKWVRHPATYVLSLGVYVSTWAIYGSVGYAYTSGFNFLAYYLGVSSIFLLAPIFLGPILRLSRVYQLTSLADMFSFRYRSPLAGTVTTIGMIAGMLPFLALQIQAVAESVHVLTQEFTRNYLAFGFCIMIILFAILFGARHTTAREKHQGLVVAIAFETVVKLVTMIAVATFSLFGVFDGFGDLQQWLSETPEAIDQLYKPLAEGSWHSLISAFFVSAIVLPHIYHMAFTENLNPRSLVAASWGVPLFSFILALCIPIILWAAMKNPPNTSPDYFTLGVGLANNSPSLSILIFIGGLSAASGIIIVSTMALASMSLNHLVLPFYQPLQHSSIYRWILWTKRILITVIILGSYGFYHLLEHKNTLTELGVLGSVASLQFVPGLIGVLFWPRANRYGFISGLCVGFILWALTLLLPFFTTLDQFSLISGGSVDDFWHRAAILSTSCNIFVFIFISMLTPISSSEKKAAETCVIGSLKRPHRWQLDANNAKDFIRSLSNALGKDTAQKEITLALNDLSYTINESRPYALRRLRDQLETNLSSLLGPAVALEIVDESIPYKTSDQGSADDIHFIEGKMEDYKNKLTGLAAELDSLRRFHRQTLFELPLGTISLSDNHEIIGWNRQMEELTKLRSNHIVGAYLSMLPEPWKTLLITFANDKSGHLYQQQIKLHNEFRWISLHKAAISMDEQQGQHLVIVIEDITNMHHLEEKLSHNERLASIGQFAAGIAHEIGNPVTGIACLAQTLKAEQDHPDVQEMSGQIIDQTRRISTIVQSLVNFSHSNSQQSISEAVNMYQVSREAMQLLSLSMESNTDIFQNKCDPDATVLGDPQRLIQAMVNLLGNASHPSVEASHICVESENIDDTVVISVIDNGCGIPEDLIDNIMQPFVTTKVAGQGTGLGLALVSSIIEDHYGSIRIISPAADGRGTKVIISLPRHLEENDQFELGTSV